MTVSKDLISLMKGRILYILYIRNDDTFNHGDYMFYSDSYNQTKPC